MEDFRSVPDEVRNLLKEIEATKESIKAVSSRLAAIEKHVRRAFHVPRPTKKAERGKPAPTLEGDQLLAKFDIVRSQIVGDSAVAGDAILEEWPDTDLRGLAAELGAPNSKKLPMEKIRAFVMQKIRESIMLGTNNLRGIEQRGPRDSAEPGRDTESDA